MSEWAIIHNVEEYREFLKANGFAYWDKEIGDLAYPFMVQLGHHRQLIFVTCSDAFRLLTAKRALARRKNQKRGRVPS